MNKNLKIRMGDCNHRKYIPRLLDLIRSGRFVLPRIITQQPLLAPAIDAYKAFDTRQPGRLKVEFVPRATAR